MLFGNIYSNFDSILNHFLHPFALSKPSQVLFLLYLLSKSYHLLFINYSYIELVKSWVMENN